MPKPQTTITHKTHRRQRFYLYLLGVESVNKEIINFPWQK